MPQAAAATDLSIDACRERYVRNLAALYRRDGDLAERIDALPFSAVPPLEPTRSGTLTARLDSDDGRQLYAHSKYDPDAEATQLAAGAVDDAQVVVLCGFGLGHHVAAIRRRWEEPTIVAAESDLSLLKAALALHDLAELIAERRLIFLTSVDRRQVHAALSPLNAEFMQGAAILRTPLSQRRGKDFFDGIQAAVADFVDSTRTQIITLVQTARTTVENLLMNLPSYVAGDGVEALAGAARGVPAVIIAAGPSLAKNIDQIAPLRERAVLIAVQTVFKLLRRLGIEPHFVTSLDYHEVSADFFRDVADVGRCTLVAEPKVAWHVPDVYPGRVRMPHHKMYDTLLGPLAPRRGLLRQGSTVAHLAFYLAEYLGCDPIVFVGQDLAFTEGLFYLPGSPIEQTWAPEMNRFCTIETKQWERIVRNRGILRRATDVNGHDVYTDNLLFTYAEQFQKDFLDCRAKIIQASEGGLALAGTESLPLREAVERFFPERAALSFGENSAESHSEAGRADVLAAVLKQLEMRQDELIKVDQIARDMRSVLEKLATLTDRPAEFNRLVGRVDELRGRMRRHDDLYRLVVEVSAGAELRRYSADRRLGKVQAETSETARRRLSRDIEFVTAFADGCAFLQGLLPRVIERFRGGAA